MKENAIPDSIRLIDVGMPGGIHQRWEPFYGLLEVRAFEPDPSDRLPAGRGRLSRD